MAIYISGVKGLPEQVQANKEDIKQIKEDIANIDFDAIRELTAQVGENTQDINNLENGQGVQDQAINGLGDRVGTAEGRITQLESDTRKITYNATDDETTIQGTTKIAIIKNNRIGDDDSEIRFGTNQGIVLKQGTHTLNYDDDGKLYLDGVEIQPVTPTPPKYEHNISLIYGNSSNGYYNITLSIINDNNAPFTISTLKSYLYQNGFNTTAKTKTANGYINFLTESTRGNIFAIYASSISNLNCMLIKTNITGSDTNTTATILNETTIYDNIVEI